MAGGCRTLFVASQDGVSRSNDLADAITPTKKRHSATRAWLASPGSSAHPFVQFEPEVGEVSVEVQLRHVAQRPTGSGQQHKVVKHKGHHLSTTLRLKKTNMYLLNSHSSSVQNKSACPHCNSDVKGILVEYEHIYHCVAGTITPQATASLSLSLSFLRQLLA